MRVIKFLLLSSFFILSIDIALAAERKHVIIPQLGVYELNSGSTGGYTYDTKSDQVFSFDYERRFTNGITIGAELMHFKNSNIQTPSAGDLEANVFFFNAKYYFNFKPNARFRPFIGLGHGYAFGETKYEDGGGIAYQGIAGIAYEWDRVGMYFQYKRMHSKMKLKFIFTEYEYDISGQGFFSGVSVKF